MTVFKKLQKARYELSRVSMKKSGRNGYAEFDYFELGDFLPTVHNVFGEIGLCGVFSFDQDDNGKEWCRLRIVDVDDPAIFVDFNSPVVYAQMSKANPIQALGATHTYMRRYMWLVALELTENDQVDALDQSSFKQQAKPVPVKNKLQQHELQIESPIAPPMESIDESTPKIDAPSSELFVEVMVKFGEACESEQKLAQLWKVNQKSIDDLQKNDEQLFNNLKSMFGEFRTMLKEKSNGI
jgi:ERF superfamily